MLIQSKGGLTKGWKRVLETGWNIRVSYQFYWLPCPSWNLQSLLVCANISSDSNIKEFWTLWSPKLIYTESPRRNLSYFETVFLMLKYTNITQNTCVQNWTVTEIMAREKCGLLFVPSTIPISWETFLFYFDCELRRSISAVFVAPALESPILSQCVTYSAWDSKNSYYTASEFFVVRFNGVTSLTS
jgi:hypothetical protein